MSPMGRSIVSTWLLAAFAATAAAAVPVGDGAASHWPNTTSSNGSSVTIYQPQATSWPERKQLTALTAISITPAGQTKPMLGTISLMFRTQIDAASGLVGLSDPQLLETHFPALDTARATAIEAKIRAALPAWHLPQVPLDAVLLSLKQLPVSAVPVNNDPPTIYYSSLPASLVVFDGEPLLAPIPKTDLSFAVNTNWFVFVYQGTWYLLDDGLWLTAKTATGPYAPIARLPTAFDALPAGGNFAEVRKHIPASAAKSPANVRAILVSTKPAEIIVTAGAPKLQPIWGTALSRVSNTPAALFFDNTQHQYYVLLSGRWFSAANLAGPWVYATESLPADFALIPPGSPAGAVLVSVPGTVAAQEAVLKAQIPTTATLKRNVTTITVVYAGAPRFEPVPGTVLLHAVNTASVVLKVADKFYVCENGAWFVALAPSGPWLLADAVPPAIHSIPPSSPLYPVTYVYVYAATPVSVTYGFTSGYMMGFVSAGVLVYGTGYYYPPVIIAGPMPIYYPYPYTYAGAVYYNPANGAWARGGTIYGPYGGAATGARYYNPSTGAYAQGGAIYGRMAALERGPPITPRRVPMPTAAPRGAMAAGRPTRVFITGAPACPAARSKMPILTAVGDRARSAARTKPSTRKAAAMRMGLPADSIPPQAHRAPAITTTPPAITVVSSRLPMAMCTPVTTAMSTNTAIVAGPNGTAAAGRLCSRRRTRMGAARRALLRRRRADAAPAPVPVDPARAGQAPPGVARSIAAATSNCNKIASAARPARRAASAAVTLAAGASGGSRRHGPIDEVSCGLDRRAARPQLMRLHQGRSRFRPAQIGGRDQLAENSRGHLDHGHR